MPKLEVTYKKVNNLYEYVNFSIRGVKQRNEKVHKLVIRNYQLQGRFTIHPVGMDRWKKISENVVQNMQKKYTLDFFTIDKEPYTLIEGVFSTRDYSGLILLFQWLEENRNQPVPHWFSEWQSLLSTCDKETEYLESYKIGGFMNEDDEWVQEHRVKIPDTAVKLPKKESKFFFKKD